MTSGDIFLGTTAMVQSTLTAAHFLFQASIPPSSRRGSAPTDCSDVF